MFYIIYSEDVANSLEKRLTTRPAHLAGFSGSLVVAEFASLAEAQSWADADPYLAAGVYVRSTVKPFKKVLP